MSLLTCGFSVDDVTDPTWKDQSQMSSDVIRYTLEGVLSRRAVRALTRLDDHRLLGNALVDATAELQAHKADALGAVAGRSMQDVALLSQMEQQLAQTVPLASGRLAAIADTAALGLTDVVSQATHRLRRY